MYCCHPRSVTVSRAVSRVFASGSSDSELSDVARRVSPVTRDTSDVTLSLTGQKDRMNVFGVLAGPGGLRGWGTCLRDFARFLGITLVYSVSTEASGAPPCA